MKTTVERELADRIAALGDRSRMRPRETGAVFRAGRVCCLDSVDVGDERNDELGVSDPHRQAAPVGRRRSDVTDVVAPRTRRLSHRWLLLLSASSWYREPGMTRVMVRVRVGVVCLSVLAVPVVS